MEEVATASPHENERDQILARVDALETVRVADALAVGARLAGIEATVEALGEVQPIGHTSVADSTGCIAFLPTVRGYRFVELTGPPPEVGSSLELADGEFVVVGRGRSPLPHDGRPCAYLEHAHGED